KVPLRTATQRRGGSGCRASILGTHTSYAYRTQPRRRPTLTLRSTRSLSSSRRSVSNQIARWARTARPALGSTCMPRSRRRTRVTRTLRAWRTWRCRLSSSSSGACSGQRSRCSNWWASWWSLLRSACSLSCRAFWQRSTRTGPTVLHTSRT
ncbi:hypothetical protein H4R19_005716, partial [Coemansia spiralis]